MLTKVTIPTSVHTLAKKVNSGKIRFDLAIQRRGVWKLDQKQNLIDSLLNNYPVPPVYFVDNEDKDSKDKQQWALDGQQRTRAITEFVNDGFALSDTIVDWKDEDGTTHDIKGLKYDELPEDVLVKLNSTNISTVILKDITDEEVTEMFKRLNAGTPFRKIELIRIDMPRDITHFVNEVAEHEFFKSKINVSEKARVHFSDHELILRTLMLYLDHKKDFSGKEIRNFVMDSIITAEQKSDFINTLDYANIAFPEKTKVLKKTSIPIILKIIKNILNSDKDKIPANTFGDRVTEFIKKQKSGSAYNNTCSAGSAKKENVMKRLEILENAITVA